MFTVDENRIYGAALLKMRICTCTVTVVHADVLTQLDGDAFITESHSPLEVQRSRQNRTQRFNISKIPREGQ